MSEQPLVDTHVHVFTRDMPLVAKPRHRPDYDFTHEQLTATLDAHGVTFAVIAAASPWGDYNDCILAALRAHPRRLRGTAILSPTAGRYELEGMARGSGLPISRLLILQARAEVMRANKPAAPPSPECTTFGVAGLMSLRTNW